MAEVNDSILDSVKKVLGLSVEYTVFDQDIIMHINTVFGTLQQLGVGPENSYSIQDNTPKWDDFLQGKLNLNGVRTYMFVRVRLLFDPPTTSFAISAMEKVKDEFEWRLNVQAEEVTN